MAKVKLTKNALKAERDALKRFQRYLPTLLLKKQQLQMEMRTLQERVMAKRDEEDKLRKSMSPGFRCMPNLSIGLSTCR